MVIDMAASSGDSLYAESLTAGGATFYVHSIDTIVQAKIMQGNWDFVILQGQSLELWGSSNPYPSPAAGVLDSLINQYNPCGETMFYMTWGRKNGFGTYTYETMDSMIHLNYMNLADTLNAVVSPVSAVWRYIRQMYPSIELYDPDESHPSVAGSYAAACSFYTAIFRKDPTFCTYNSTLSAADASNIRSAAKLIVYDSLLNWHIGEYDSLFVNCTGTGEQEIEKEQWNIYPNPATTTISFNFKNESNTSIQLYNSLGLLLKEYDATTQSINIAHLSNGIYFLKQKGKQKGKIFLKQ